MTAVFHASGPHACTPIDACRQVMSHPAVDRCGLAAYLGVSLDTLDRMRRAPTDSRWSDARVQAVKRYEELVLGTDTVRAALLARELRQAGCLDPLAAVRRDIGEHADLIGLENRALADNAIDQREGAAIADAMERQALHLIDGAAAVRAGAAGGA